ncbi:ROK family transcriptional regulator [Galactobacter valiniphilus]|uniref:ROK family transcriptional regulator n=1 Tax=Galactobacter valiniphilus TaxID=2676122 RepID=UPI003735CAFD
MSASRPSAPAPAGATHPTAIGADDVRRQNLSAVLRHVQRAGSLSRSTLTRATGLNRSTVAALVADLARRGLVEERAGAGQGRAGRPSAVVSGSEAAVAVAVHPELDAIELAMVTVHGRILHRARYRNPEPPSPAHFLSVVPAMLEGMLSAAEAPRPLGIGVAVPGVVNEHDGVVQWAPHLGWRDVPLAEELAARTGLPAMAVNDASAGAMAECLFGAGRGARHLVFLNGGASGIGGGIAVGGELLRGASGHAGEFGHTLVDASGPACECGATGCLETVVRRDRLGALGAPEGAELAGAMRSAWGGEDPLGVELRLQLDALGTALRNASNTLNPDRVVFGGYLADLLSAAGEPALRAAMSPLVAGAGVGPELVGAELGDSLMLIGAAEAVFAPIVADPTLVPAVPAEV